MPMAQWRLVATDLVSLGSLSVRRRNLAKVASIEKRGGLSLSGELGEGAPATELPIVE